MRWRTVLGLSLAAALGSAACAPNHGQGYMFAFATGERAFRAGRYDEAALAYRDAAAKALRARDRDEAVFLVARSWERAEKWNEARAALKLLITDSPKGERSERAVFELADIEIQHGDAALGFSMLDKATREHSTHGLARPSIHRMIMHAQDTGGEAAALAWLDAHVPIFRNTDQDEVISYERALSFERAGQHDAAHEAFLDCAKRHPYPKGGLTDDAYWRVAQIDEERGRWQEAVTHLEQLLAPRESAIGMGSYERPRYSPAQLEIAVLYRDKLHDRKAARREFAKLYSAHKTSIYRDDALWSGARLAREDGDADEACALVKRLVKEFPESRYTRCAHDVCASAPEAKLPCADYILRELRGEARD